MKRKQFAELLKAKLESQGKEIDAKKIESAISKTGRAMVAREGSVEWSENEVDNAVYFYDEFGASKTFNRTNYRNNR